MFGYQSNKIKLFETNQWTKKKYAVIKVGFSNSKNIYLLRYQIYESSELILRCF
jgi:hypothetical protein